MFAVAAEGAGNQLAVNLEGEAVVIDVHSQRGIGAATVELISGAAPKTIVMRLYLKGLEEFRLSYGQREITGRVSSGDSSVDQSVASPDAGEQPITNASRFWMNITIISDQATAHIPLDQGYFEIRLPEEVLQEGRRLFAIRWVDFYR
jgi:hypothetical protein